MKYGPKNISSRPCFQFFGIYIPRSRITGSYAHSIFNFLCNGHNVFHSGCTNLHSLQQCRGFQCLHSLIYTYFLCFVIVAILMGVKWPLILYVLIFHTSTTTGITLYHNNLYQSAYLSPPPLIRDLPQGRSQVFFTLNTPHSNAKAGNMAGPEYTFPEYLPPPHTNV